MSIFRFDWLVDYSCLIYQRCMDNRHCLGLYWHKLKPGLNPRLDPGPWTVVRGGGAVGRWRLYVKLAY